MVSLLVFQFAVRLWNFSPPSCVDDSFISVCLNETRSGFFKGPVWIWIPYFFGGTGTTTSVFLIPFYLNAWADMDARQFALKNVVPMASFQAKAPPSRS